MLRIGLTGNLGSGKSTAATLFAAHGAHILASDSMGRDLMQPGQPAFDEIAAHFGPTVLLPDGTLNRPSLARIAFTEGRVEELNAIIHPAVIARQAALAHELSICQPNAVLIVESALLFETKYGAIVNDSIAQPRFDRIILVAAPESDKIDRFVHRQYPRGTPSSAQRQTLEAEAHRRLALQIPDAVKAPRCDHILTNDGSLSHLQSQVDALWPILLAAAEPMPRTGEVLPESLQ